ncbi:trans-resveratrol di-O-methyltransferase-like [Pyrus ussuriensis x Pyrus communis]|uniref:Trans-resveratrol di-O-methyltransferase-like n=1 Tax=Pyrus ussuriensis x Pyrus communis TaxID=2448454 RepID=A0A5N5F3S4_9ROSA|nr:trans-resveratrol di-O-methyltransferase-like [Pyrus ussuriensis x Pyrus communis]
MPFWELNAKKPTFGGLFNEAMEADSKLIARVAVEECGGVFEGLKSLVDVEEGMAHNLGFVGGDMFDKIPPANAILLKIRYLHLILDCLCKWILHDWNDEESVKILKKCRESMLLSKNEGREKIIIIDIVVGYDKKSIETQLMFDMLMMSTVTNKERSESEWENIFLAAGFIHHNITHTLSLRSLIEVYP